MADSLAAIEDDLDRATELETDEAVELLRTARSDLDDLDGESIDDDRRRDLEHRLEQRLREVQRRDEYDGGLGSAMNPEDDEAP